MPQDEVEQTKAICDECRCGQDQHDVHTKVFACSKVDDELWVGEINSAKRMQESPGTINAQR